MIWFSRSGELIPYIKDLLEGKIPCNTILFTTFKKPLVWSGNKKDLIGFKEAKRRQVDYQKTNSIGGTVVISAGAVAMIKVVKDENLARSFIRECYTLISNKLAAINVPIAQHNNDLVLTNGDKKFGAFTLKELPNGQWFGCVLINLYVDKEFIKRTCTSIKREPAGLSEYGLTSAQVTHWFEEYWKDVTWIEKP